MTAHYPEGALNDRRNPDLDPLDELEPDPDVAFEAARDERLIHE